jgi:hypothetical protein
MSKVLRKCADCGEANATIRADGVGWLCPRCVGRRVNDPENMKYTQADMDLQEYLENGGKLS